MGVGTRRRSSAVRLAAAGAQRMGAAPARRVAPPPRTCSSSTTVDSTACGSPPESKVYAASANGSCALSPVQSRPASSWNARAMLVSRLCCCLCCCCCSHQSSVQDWWLLLRGTVPHGGVVVRQGELPRRSCHFEERFCAQNKVHNANISALPCFPRPDSKRCCRLSEQLLHSINIRTRSVVHWVLQNARPASPRPPAPSDPCTQL